MRYYNHRDRNDLESLRTDLSLLTPAQKAAIWITLVRTGLFKPLWPIRLGVWISRKAHGDEASMPRLINGLLRLPPSVLEKEWETLLAHLTGGKNAEDPTSAGGFNRRGLNDLLKIAQATGWQPPE